MDHSHHNHNHHIINTTISNILAQHIHHNINTTDNITMEHIHDTTKIMDHSGHGSMSHEMMMVMHSGFKETIVFPGWKTNTVGELIGSCFALFLIAFAYEGLKLFRDKVTEVRMIKRKSKVEFQDKNKSNNKEFNLNVVDIINEVEGSYFKKLISLNHVLQTCMHIIQFSISYFLMLAFMTYNYWLCGSIICGVGIGFFFFGVRRSKIDLNEDCH